VMNLEGFHQLQDSAAMAHPHDPLQDHSDEERLGLCLATGATIRRRVRDRIQSGYGTTVGKPKWTSAETRWSEEQ
jgi:hypothetical protein